MLTFKICPGYISETVRYRELMLGREVCWGLGLQHYGPLNPVCGSYIAYGFVGV